MTHSTETQRLTLADRKQILRIVADAFGTLGRDVNGGETVVSAAWQVEKKLRFQARHLDEAPPLPAAPAPAETTAEECDHTQHLWLPTTNGNICTGCKQVVSETPGPQPVSEPLRECVCGCRWRESEALLAREICPNCSRKIPAAAVSEPASAAQGKPDIPPELFIEQLIEQARGAAHDYNELRKGFAPLQEILGLTEHATCEQIVEHVADLKADALRLHREKMALLFPEVAPPTTTGESGLRECDWHGALTVAKWRAHPRSDNEIMGEWAEDNSTYIITVPHQLRDILIRAQHAAWNTRSTPRAMEGDDPLVHHGWETHAYRAIRQRFSIPEGTDIRTFIAEQVERANRAESALTRLQSTATQADGGTK